VTTTASRGTTAFVVDSATNEPVRKFDRTIHTTRPAIPAALAQVIWALLDPAPQQRPRTAMAALALLARALPPGAQGLWPEWATGILPDMQTGPPPTYPRREQVTTSRRQ
jgi:hypothetical protein